MLREMSGSTRIGLERAVQQAGGKKALADLLSIDKSAISKWFATGAVPINRVIAVEAATGISRYAIRPDIFGPPPDEAA